METKFISSDIEEKFDYNCSKEQIPMILALQKALDVERKCTSGIIIAADTIVYKNKVYGKPENYDDAFNTLRNLSGTYHYVVSGVAVVEKNTTKRRIFYDTTKVYFKELKDTDIINYINTDEVWDKAGSYGIQGEGASLIEKYDGDFYNVMGLPITMLKKFLTNDFGVKI